MLKDRYELKEPLGQGGFAVTYRAVDHLLGRYVAVKVSTVSLAHEANVLRALEYVPFISHIYLQLPASERILFIMVFYNSGRSKREIQRDALLRKVNTHPSTNNTSTENGKVVYFD